VSKGVSEECRRSEEEHQEAKIAAYGHYADETVKISIQSYYH
jgi:hypothetical protein